MGSARRRNPGDGLTTLTLRRRDGIDAKATPPQTFVASILRISLQHALPNKPEGAADRATHRNYLLGADLSARHGRFQPVLESTAQRRSALQHAARESNRQRSTLVDKQLSSERADMKRELFNGQAHDRVGAQIAGVRDAHHHWSERREH